MITTSQLLDFSDRFDNLKHMVVVARLASVAGATQGEASNAISMHFLDLERRMDEFAAELEQIVETTKLATAEGKGETS